MSLAQLKAEILEQVSKLESEKALLEIQHLLLQVSEKEKSLTDPGQAEAVFGKAVEIYDSVLAKLAR